MSDLDVSRRPGVFKATSRRRHRVRRTLAAAAVALLAVACSGLPSALAFGSAAPPDPGGTLGPWRHVCPQQPAPGIATCMAMWRSGVDGPLPGPPSGALTPAQLQDAYRLTGVRSTRTVAVIGPYGFPRMADDLAVYRQHFKLGPCTMRSGCLRIVNQHGGHRLPPFNEGWAVEKALDVEAVSAACPTCRILVVEARSYTMHNLGVAVSYAATQRGVAATANPYAAYAAGDTGDARFGRFFDHPGVASVASSGDDGFLGPAYPADSHFVTAAGGTSLRPAHNRRGWVESAWNLAGSGCSRLNRTFRAQAAVDTGCGRYRAMSDVAAAAGRHGGLAVYGPFNRTQSGWFQSGGTSQSAVIIATVFAMSGHTGGLAPAIPYRHSHPLFDVTHGANGRGCLPRRLCTAGRGWDGPTGLGTPNGVGAF